MNDFPVSLELPVMWGDLDALGHVNNTKYFRWFESVRVLAFSKIGLSADSPSKIGPLLATTSCDFLAPITYPDTIVAGTRIPRIGNTSFTMEYAIARTAAPETFVARGSGVIVLVNYETSQKVAVPDDMRAAIEALG